MEPEIQNDLSNLKNCCNAIKRIFKEVATANSTYGREPTDSCSKGYYLGVTIDIPMRFSTYVEELLVKVNKTFTAFTVLARESGGYSCKSLRTLYKGVALSILIY